MRKQMKIAAVVSAAALLALGASITSFAAQRGTWKYEDGEWYCYDKNGDVYENTFCLSNGKEFYVGDDGAMVRSSWVEDDGDYYFVNSAGQKITNDWRLTSPYDDEDAEEQWFYFQSNGKRAEDKKLVIKGKTYFFNSDGEMLTGWVQGNDSTWEEASASIESNSTTYYCDETGARLESAWVYDYAPEVDRDDPGSDDDEYYFYMKSSGKAATGKQSNISGQTYFFNNEGKMLTGWIAKTSSDADYDIIWEDDDDTDGTYSDSIAEIIAGADDKGKVEIYFCAEDGHMRKNKWIKTWNNVDFGEDDDDNDEYWFYLEKSGKLYVPSSADATALRYKLVDGEGDDFSERFDSSNYSVDGSSAYGVAQKKINGKTYLFDMSGQMMTRFVKIDTANNDTFEDGMLYYFGTGDDGAKKDGSISITDDSGASFRFYFATDTKSGQYYYNAAGITGAKNGKLYEDGILIKAEDAKYEVKTVAIGTGTYDFIVNQSGSIQTSGKDYEDDGDVVVPADGWTFSKDAGALKGSVLK